MVFWARDWWTLALFRWCSVLLIASAGTCHYFTRGFSGVSFELLFFAFIIWNSSVKKNVLSSTIWLAWSIILQERQDNAYFTLFYQFFKWVNAFTIFKHYWWFFSYFDYKFLIFFLSWEIKVEEAVLWGLSGDMLVWRSVLVLMT